MQNDGAGQSQSNELVFIDQHNTVGLLGVQIITFIICAGIARIPYANAKWEIMQYFHLNVFMDLACNSGGGGNKASSSSIM